MAYRAIVDTVGHSESLAKLTHLAERLYWRLVAHSDAHGRVPGSPSKTRAMCFPLLDITHDEVGYALVELEQVARIWVYEVDGKAAIQIVAFEENQPKEFIRRRGDSRSPDRPKPHTKQTSFAHVLYKLPANDDDSGTTPGLLLDHSGTESEGFVKTPANAHHSRTTPATGGTTPATRNLSIEVNPTAAVTTTRTRDPEPETDAAAAEELEELERHLDDLAIPTSLRDRARTEQSRALAVARYTIANAGGGAYFRKVFDSGDWPKIDTKAKAPLKPFDHAKAAITTLAKTDDFEERDATAELDAHGIVDPAERTELLAHAAAIRKKIHQPDDQADAA